MIYNLVSVIVITYNQEQTLSKTLDSILEQRTNFNFQIVISDDCSRDNTQSIINDYKKKFSNKIIVNNNSENLGIIRNYYKAYSLCNGKYISNCAGDDWWSDVFKLQKQVDVLEKHSDVGLVYSNYLEFHENSGKYRKVLLPTQVDFFSIILNNSIAALTVCYKKELIDDYITEIDPLSRDWMMEDLPMWLWISQKSKIHILNDITSIYRVSDKSITQESDLEKRVNFQENVSKIRLFFIHKFQPEEFAIVEEKNTIDLCYLYIKYNSFDDLKITAKLIKGRNLKTYVYKLISFRPEIFSVYRYLFVR